MFGECFENDLKNYDQSPRRNIVYYTYHYCMRTSYHVIYQRVLLYRRRRRFNYYLFTRIIIILQF